MPYSSNAQRKFFHTQTAKDKGISPAVVNEFDQASKGMKLPEHAKKYPVLAGRKHIQRLTEQ